MTKKQTVLVTGGGGYVGSALIPKLLEQGHHVKVYDLFIYGEQVLDGVKGNPKLELIRGDIRHSILMRESLKGCDTVIHLACISNDPSFELNPELGKTINLDAFRPLVEASIQNDISRFIYASSSSVYGIKDVDNVTEEMALEPLTDYSKFKAQCEDILAEYQSPDFTTVTLRPATVCGYSPRQRLDVIVNILTNHAYHTGQIKVFGGTQKRPNIHIQDMVNAYLLLLDLPKEKIAGDIFNVGFENYTVQKLAEIVQSEVTSRHVELVHVPTDDNRSYHISSQKIKDVLGFETQHSIQEAVADLIKAFDDKRLVDTFSNSNYFNIKRMQEIDLK